MLLVEIALQRYDISVKRASFNCESSSDKFCRGEQDRICRISDEGLCKCIGHEG